MIILGLVVFLIVAWNLEEICQKVGTVIRNRKKSTDREFE